MEIYNKNKKTVKTILESILKSLNEDQKELNLDAKNKFNVDLECQYYLIGVNGHYTVYLNNNETDDTHGFSELYNKHIEKRNSFFNSIKELYNITLTPSNIVKNVFSVGTYEWVVTYDTHRLIEEE